MLAPAPSLPEGYYLENFWQILRSVTRLYEDLCNEEEKAFLRDFALLSQDAQRLYVRLLSRKGECFRLDRIDYSEIPALEQSVAELEAKAFVGALQALPVEIVLGKLLRKELEELAAQLAPDVKAKTLRKDALLQALCAAVSAQELHDAACLAVPMLRLLRWEVTLVFRLMVFGSLSYDLTDFVLQEIGMVVYEEVPISREFRLFANRKAIDERLSLSQSRDAIAILLDAGAFTEARALAAPVLHRTQAAIAQEGDAWEPTSLRHVDRILNRIGRELERREAWDDALTYFAHASAPPARERQARILLRLERPDEALALCTHMMAEPRDETEAPVAQRIADKARKMRGEPVAPRKRRKRKQLTLQMPKPTKKPVEEAALQELATRQKRGVHGENALWLSLFGLAFWDVIFASLPGAFQHPFQRGPLDLYQPSFRTQREELFATRLARLHQPDWQAILRATFAAKRGRANAFVRWDWLTASTLEAVLRVLPGAHLAVVCDRLSRDVRRYRRGFPDLFVWTSEASSYELLEVKAPGDQLRPEQAAWLDVFADAGIPAAILRVTFTTPDTPVQGQLF